MTGSISDSFRVQQGRPIWIGTFKAAFDSIIKDPKNESKAFDVTVKPLSMDAQYWQHKYYRGYLLPAIAAESFDDMPEKAHFTLKKMLLIQHVSGWDEIPEKHLKTGFPLTREHIDENGEVQDELYAYIPSTSSLTKKEFEGYIKKVEMLAADLQLTFKDEHGNNVEKEAVDARRRGFGR